VTGASTPIWSRLVGQDDVVAELSHAVADAERIRHGERGPAMTHAWLITGPPGSGRSTAAISFATALVCLEDGCGVCDVCRTAPGGGHPDVDLVATDTLSYKTDDARDLVLRSTLAPIAGPWHVIVIEDADRLTDQAVNVLLKSLEEPPPHTVWVLCAPSVEDVLPTVVSRTRHVPLRTPSTADVAELLVATDGADEAMAVFAAQASQGHIGRARALARDEHVRSRRQEVLAIPGQLTDVPSCFTAAAALLAAATEDARAITDQLDAAEEADLATEYGDSATGVTAARMKKLMASATKDLAARQKTRRTRTVRDQVDRALVDLMGLFRDVLVLQVGGSVDLINDQMRPQLMALATRSTANDSGRRLRALDYCRAQIESSVTPQVALESLMVELKDPWIRVA
jgi:DNA polymerase-3 subunit delta'